MAEYSDIPAGFMLANQGRAQYKDIPAGFSISPARRQFVGPPVPSAMDRVRSAISRVGTKPDVDPGVNRGLGRFGRMGADVVGFLPMAAADAGVAARNLATGSKYEMPSAIYARGLESVGLPRAEGTAEKVVDVLGQMVLGAKLPVPQVANPAPRVIPMRPPSTATAPGAATLENAGVRLDRSQREGGRLMQMVRAITAQHPATADKQFQFESGQLKDFTRAVLRRIGADSDEATQPVMLAAKRRIGSVFNSVGSKGAQFDDALQTELATIIDDMTRTVPESYRSVIQRNVDDLLSAVDETGKIAGPQFNRIRSHLSALSDNADVGRVADDLQDALLEALHRSHPGERAALAKAVEQWRSMRIIEGAIAKGADRYIQPLQLSNAISSRANRAMSVYGQGGDQQLVSLAQAGRSVLPKVLADSGTSARESMQSIARSTMTAPLYIGAQNYLMRQPQAALPPGAGVLRNALVPSVVGANALLRQE